MWAESIRCTFLGLFCLSKNPESIVLYKSTSVASGKLWNESLLFLKILLSPTFLTGGYGESCGSKMVVSLGK